MRAHRWIIGFCLFMVVMSFSGVARAQDIFVKPSGTAQHPVDLGIAIKPNAAPPTQKPVQQPVQTPPVLQPTEPPVQPVAPTPSPTHEPPKPQPTPEPIIIPNDNVQIIPVPEQPITTSGGNGPNTLSVSVQQGVIGPIEASEIFKSLGLNAQEAATNCVFEHMVVASIGDGGFALTMGQQPAAQQHFGGTINTLVVSPTIACKKVKRPVSGTIIEQGSYYKIGARDVNCPTPRTGSVGLSFKYLGDGNGTCNYK